MSFQNLNVTGEVLSDESVREINVDTKEVSLDCGDENIVLEGNITKITLRKKIIETLRSARVSTGAAVAVDYPDGTSEFITTMDSERLKDENGNDLPAPDGANYRIVHQGKAAQDETSSDPTEEGPSVNPDDEVKELPQDTPFETAPEAPQTTDF